jgi:outer membrane protein OmpA-like peptidoglycan-associated protein
MAALLAAFGAALIALPAPARAGGNDQDQPAYTPPPRPAPARAAAPSRGRTGGLDFQTIVIGGGTQADVIVDMSVLDELTGDARPQRPARPRRPAPATRPAAPPAPPAAAIEEPAAPVAEAPTPPVAASAPPAAPPAPVEPPTAELPTAEPPPVEAAPPPPPPVRPVIDSATPRTLTMVELGSRLSEPATEVAAAPPPPPPPPPPVAPPPPPPPPPPVAPPPPAAPPPPPPASEAAPDVGRPTELAALPPPPPSAATSSALPSVAKAVTQVVFETSGNALDDAAKASLDAVIEQLKAPGGRLLLRGFASGTNDTTTGARRLALQRVQAVRTYLIEKGVPANRIDLRAVGMAPDAPIADGVDIAIMP